MFENEKAMAEVCLSMQSQITKAKWLIEQLVKQ